MRTRLVVPVLAASGALVAGGFTTTAAAASPQRPARAADACTHDAKTHFFVQADSAENSEGDVFVHAHRATEHCGGPDDFSFVVHKDLADLVLTKHTKVRVLKGNSGSDHSIAVSKFPAYLKHDDNVRIFTVSGKHTAVTKLTERFHP